MRQFGGSSREIHEVEDQCQFILAAKDGEMPPAKEEPSRSDDDAGLNDGTEGQQQLLLPVQLIIHVETSSLLKQASNIVKTPAFIMLRRAVVVIGTHHSIISCQRLNAVSVGWRNPIHKFMNSGLHL